MIHCRRRDEGRLARAPGRHRRRHAERDRRVQASTACSSSCTSRRCRSIDWAGSAGKGPVREDAERSSRAPTSAARTRAPSSRPSSSSSRRRGRGSRCVILRPGQIFGGGIPLHQRRGRARRRRALARARRRQARAAAGLHRRRRRRDHADDRAAGSTGGEVIQIIDPDRLTQADVLALAGGGRSIVRVPRPLVFAARQAQRAPARGARQAEPDRALPARSPRSPRCTTRAIARAILLGWTPRVGVREGIRRVLQGEHAPPAGPRTGRSPRQDLGPSSSQAHVASPVRSKT